MSLSSEATDNARYSYLITYFEDKQFKYEEFISKYECKNTIICKEVCPRTQRIHYHMYTETPCSMIKVLTDIKSKGDLRWIKEKSDIKRVVHYVMKDGELVFIDINKDFALILL